MLILVLTHSSQALLANLSNGTLERPRIEIAGRVGRQARATAAKFVFSALHINAVCEADHPAIRTEPGSSSSTSLFLRALEGQAVGQLVSSGQGTVAVRL